MSILRTVLADGDVRLEPLADVHVEPLRAACARDTEIWDIYPFSMLGDHFDPSLARYRGHAAWVQFAVLYRDVVVGMTSYIDIAPSNRTVEIGGTYIEPAVRGAAGINRRVKRLMIDHALACGFTRIEFRVDARNLRSRAAVLKLGATHEGTLRRNRITWTGFVRDTCIFGLLAEEWSGGDA